MNGVVLIVSSDKESYKYNRGDTILYISKHIRFCFDLFRA